MYYIFFEYIKFMASKYVQNKLNIDHMSLISTRLHKHISS